MFTPFLRSLSPPANKAHILQAGAIAVCQCTAVPKPRSSRKKVSADLSNSKKAWHLPAVVGEEVAHLSLMQQREHEVMFTPFLRSLSPPANKAHILQAGGYSGLSVHSFTAVPKPRSSRKKVSADLSNSKKAWHLQIHPWLDGGEVVDKKPCTTGMAGITQAKESGSVGPACKWSTK